MLAQQEQAEQVQMMLESLPTPTEPLQVKLLQGVLYCVNDLAKAVVGDGADAFALPEWEPTDEAGKAMTRWEGKMPPEVALPLFGVAMAVGAAGPEYAKKYAWTAEDMASNTGLRKIDGQLVRMKKDKKLVQALAPSEELAPAPAAGPPPESFDETDEELMAMM